MMSVMFLLLFRKCNNAIIRMGKYVTNGANPPELYSNIDSGSLVRLASQHRILLFIDDARYLGEKITLEV
jgi:hypothetical protein